MMTVFKSYMANFQLEGGGALRCPVGPRPGLEGLEGFVRGLPSGLFLPLAPCAAGIGGTGGKYPESRL